MVNTQRSGFKQSFAQSNYITAAWNWFMLLAGKAAEPVLTISVLYSCARLLPAVHIPVQIDNVVFVAQMVALDVGGLSLGKMAKAAQRANNLEGATLARRVSIALISIMIANVVLSVLQTIIPGMPGQLVAVVEAILLIARAIMAVLYAHVIHSLKRDHGNGEDGGSAVAGLDDWQMVGLTAYLMQTTQQEIAEAISEASANFNQLLTTITEEQANIQATLQQGQNTPAPAPAIDLEAIVRTITPQLRATIQGQVRAMIAESQSQVRVTPEPGQNDARATIQSQGQTHPGQPALKLLNGSKLVPAQTAKVNGTAEERLQTAYDLLSSNGARVSGRALAKEAHVNRGTANEWLERVKGQQAEPDTDAELKAIAQSR